MITLTKGEKRVRRGLKRLIQNRGIESKEYLYAKKVVNKDTFNKIVLYGYLKLKSSHCTKMLVAINKNGSLNNSKLRLFRDLKDNCNNFINKLYIEGVQFSMEV